VIEVGIVREVGERIDAYVVSELRVLRDGLCRALAEAPNIRVVAAAARWNRLGIQPDAGVPAVLLLDATGGSVVVDLADLAAFAPHVRIVMVGVDDGDAEIISYAEAGASGYLTRDGSFADLVRILEEVARGELSCSPRVAAALIRRVSMLAAGRRPASGTASLTEREAEILGLISAGLSNKEIAARLYIALATVKNHVHNVLDKLEVRSRFDAAAWYSGQRHVLSPVP
jgi:DNA-binding NarL/FixJ family response regulator